MSKKGDMDPEAYRIHKENMRQKMAEKVARANDIKELPPVVNPERRESCRLNLMRFGNIYLRSMFQDMEYDWASFHYDMTTTLQKNFLEGGLFAEALPRGSVKTGWCKAAVIWGAVYGHCKYTALIDASAQLGVETLESIKTQLEVQPLLAEDFPEVCIPIRRLEGKAAKCKGQTYQGVRTRIEWKRLYVVLPTIPGSAASGHRIGCSGITGSGIRGLVFTTATGKEVRPDAVVLNDFQTDKSVISVKQTTDRLRIIRGAICGMAGPGKPISVVAAVTVMKKMDGADQLLEWPDWQGMRHGILTALPKNMRLWNEYRDIQIDSLNKRLGVTPENEFYTAHRAEMDDGTNATWLDRYNKKKELSAIQAAMNIYYRDGTEAFWAEYMNNPQMADAGNLRTLDPEQLRKRLNGLLRYQVPLGYDTITVGADIQLPIMFYWVTAWKSGFGGSVIDIGTFPDQDGRYFARLDNLARTLQSESGAIEADVDAAVTWGLYQLGEHVLERVYTREDGMQLKVKKCHIDINWQPSEAAVARFCRLSKWASICSPARGRSISNRSGRISSWKEYPGERHPPKAIRRQCEWMFTSPKKHLVQECYHIKSFWHTRMITAFSQPMHSPGSISFYGNPENSDQHRLPIEHLTAHRPIEKKSGEEEYIEYVGNVGMRWDFLDCLINSAVAASVEGIQLDTETDARNLLKTKKPRRTIEAEYF